jgi:hypothetical protein
MNKQKQTAQILSVVNELNAQLTAQLAEKDAELAHWKANHDNMVKKNALLSQRHDLPVDRIQAAKHFDDLSAEVERLRKQQYTYLSNLTWLLERFRKVLSGSPVRDADEVILTVEQLLSTTQQEG